MVQNVQNTYRNAIWLALINRDGCIMSLNAIAIFPILKGPSKGLQLGVAHLPDS